MINTQKLIIITIMINLLFGLAAANQEKTANAEKYDPNMIESFIAVGQNTSQQLDTEETWLQKAIPQITQVTDVIGDIPKITGQLGRIVRYTIVPWSITEPPNATELEQTIIRTIMYFRAILLCLMVLEIFLWVRNRKAP